MARPTSANYDEAFIAENAETMTRQEMADHFGVTLSAMGNKLSRLGVSIKKSGSKHHKGVYDDDDVRLAIELLKDGTLTATEIAEKMELPLKYVLGLKCGKLRKGDTSAIYNDIETMTFRPGQNLIWLHGSSIRTAVVIKTDGDRVYLKGMSKNFWACKRRMSIKIKMAERSGRLANNK